ncbi:hypothetical protein ABT58_05825 [Photobacterium aphoticum]|nr:hypothetical protein ABT58_05825 [Photobacterium aphoticum]
MSGYLPIHVRQTATLLRERVAHYIYISAVKAFEPPTPHHVAITEKSPTYSPIDETITHIDNHTYGPLKATSEQIVRSLFPLRATILRPQVIIGPHDCSGRLAYWLLRAQGTGTPLLPGRGDDHLQVVDVMDIAAFMMKVIQNRWVGDFNLAGEKVSWLRFVQLLNMSHGQWVASEKIAEAGLSFRELPLYRVKGSTEASYMNIDNSKARAHGFTVTDFSHSVSRYAAWLSENGHRIPDDIHAEWLTPEQEYELVKASAGAVSH